MANVYIMEDTMTIKKALTCLLISSSIFFSSLSSASLMSEIGGVDEFIGRATLKSSGDQTELNWVQKLLSDQTISLDNKYTEEYLKKQCQYFLDAFGIDHSDLVDASYSDMLLRLSINKE